MNKLRKISLIDNCDVITANYMTCYCNKPKLYLLSSNHVTNLEDIVDLHIGLSIDATTFFCEETMLNNN